ncbi:unnamed protein product [Calicophoron daubneyi]|uniref:Uncharacterized protein n=1 Tax=Calicophoron daubneyi TaxID=300641 RepID=A0AAV2T555_CALDB
MNCFRNVRFVFFVAFVSSHTAVDATDYIIPEACREDQLFYLDGSTMSGSTFIFDNNRKANANFRFLLSQYHNQNATLTFRTGSRTMVYNASFNENVEKESMNFSLTGTWSAGDAGTVVYQSADRSLEDCYNRTATNLRVRGNYDIYEMQGGTRWIWAREGCGVTVTLYRILTYPPGKCNVTLKFGDGTTMNASSTGETITSMKGAIFFDIDSDCIYALVILYYQEDCRSTTAATSESTVPTSPSESSTKSTVSTPQTTGSSEATVSMSSTMIGVHDPTLRQLSVPVYAYVLFPLYPSQLTSSPYSGNPSVHSLSIPYSPNKHDLVQNIPPFFLYLGAFQNPLSSAHLPRPIPI